MNSKFQKSDIFFISIIGLFTLCIILPMLNLVAVSLSGEYAVTTGKVTFFPIDINFRAYKVFFMENNVVRSYINTVTYALIGTFMTLMLTCLMAYPLSLEKLRYKKFFNLLVLITMFFSGGMIPGFLLIKSLHMIDTIWAIVLPGAISAYNVIIMRTFFKGIPASLREAAYIDGANDLFVLINIIIPLSKPVFATIALFSIVGHWNSFFGPLLYLNDYIHSDEGIELFNWGVEGVTFTKDASGKRKFIDDIKTVAKPIETIDRRVTYGLNENQFFLIKLWDMTLNDVGPNYIATQEEYKKRNLISQFAAPNLVFIGDDKDFVADWQAKFNATADEYEMKFINGQMSFDKWDEYIEVLKDLGTDKAIEIYNRVQKEYDK